MSYMQPPYPTTYSDPRAAYENYHYLKVGGQGWGSLTSADKMQLWAVVDSWQKAGCPTKGDLASSRGILIEYTYRFWKNIGGKNWYELVVLDPLPLKGVIVHGRTNADNRMVREAVGRLIQIRVHISNGKESIYCISEMDSVNDKMMIIDQINALKKLAAFEAQYPIWVTPIGNWNCRKEYLEYNASGTKIELPPLPGIGPKPLDIVEPPDPKPAPIEPKPPEVESPVIPEQVVSPVIPVTSQDYTKPSYIEKLKDPKVILVIGVIVIAIVAAVALSNDI